MERWVGKTAVVTGASAGIGAAICVNLADAGMKVVGLARRAPLVEKLQSRGTIVAKQCDVSQPSEVASVFQWVDATLGGTDVLVNNAGVFYPGTMTDVGVQATTEEDLLKCIDINVKGVIVCTRHAVASMRLRGVNGHVININSIAGHYIPFESMFNVYPGSKHAVSAITASLDNELCDFGSKIKTTSISPGLVDTDLVGRNSEGPLTVPALRPEDVADAVRYVVSTPPSVNPGMNVGAVVTAAVVPRSPTLRAGGVCLDACMPLGIPAPGVRPAGRGGLQRPRRQGAGRGAAAATPSRRGGWRRDGVTRSWLLRRYHTAAAGGTIIAVAQ